jgi:hypothetical protein
MEDLGTDAMVILTLALKKKGCEIAERFLLTRVGAMVGFCERGYI